MHRKLFRFLLILLIASASMSLLLAQNEDLSPAEIENDEGGPVRIDGQLTYTNLLFLQGTPEPIILLEDQAGFVRRDPTFTLTPESQVLGIYTTDINVSPVSYTFSLPAEPQGTLVDVDQDGEDDGGVMVYQVAYWNNNFGGPYLEPRDQDGAAWSYNFGSAEYDQATFEATGGRYLVYAPDDQQGFPSGFGQDDLLFTEDDPIVGLPQGYTLVDMATDPFTFDRSSIVTMNTIEPELLAADDFSGMSYTAAFDAMIEKFRTEYAFTEDKNLDWDAIAAEFRPRFEEAEQNNDPDAYLFALRDFTWAIPDGHVGMATSSGALDENFATQTAGGLGLSLVELDDGRVLVNFLLADGPADQAGIQLQAEILEINGQPIDEAIRETIPYSSPFSTDHTRRLQQLRYVIRFPADTDVEVIFQNPGDSEPTTVTLTTGDERDSFSFSSFFRGVDFNRPPVEYEFLDSGYGLVKLNDFNANDVLTVQTFEYFLGLVKQQGIPGIIIDIRTNSGGSSRLANQLPSYFTDTQVQLGFLELYSEAAGGFIPNPNNASRIYPAPESQRYDGQVVILVGPACSSACEFFANAMSLLPTVTIVGQYPTGGLGGAVNDFIMPEGSQVRMTIGRAVDPEGNIHIEGRGVPPDVDVPVDEETAFSEGDPVLEAAIAYLDNALTATITDGGEIAIGDSVTGQLSPDSRVQYTLEVSEGDNISIFLRDETGQFDTYLRLYDSDGNLLAENDDIEPGTIVNSSLEELAVPEDMILIIEVATFEDSGQGEYTLEVVANE